MIKQYRNIGIFFWAALLVVGGVLLAGEVVNNSAPDPASIPYTLEDVYQKLTDENYTVSPTHFLYPSIQTTETSMHSLEDIFNVIPPYRELDGSTTTVEAGIYSTTTLAEIVESGLAAENIASGTTIFGITGTYECTP